MNAFGSSRYTDEDDEIVRRRLRQSLENSELKPPTDAGIEVEEKTPGKDLTPDEIRLMIDLLRRKKKFLEAQKVDAVDLEQTERMLGGK